MAYVYAAIAVAQVVSGISRSKAIKRAARRQAAINEVNARWAEYQAGEEERYGYTQAARHLAQVDNIVSDQRTMLAVQGVDVNYGSAAQVQQESKSIGFLNSLDIISQGRKRAMGLKTQAMSYRLQGQAAVAQGKSDANAAVTSGFIDATATAYGGYAKANPGDGGSTPTADKYLPKEKGGLGTYGLSSGYLLGDE